MDVNSGWFAVTSLTESSASIDLTKRIKETAARLGRFVRSEAVSRIAAGIAHLHLRQVQMSPRSLR